MASSSAAGQNSVLGSSTKAKLLRSLVKDYVPHEKHPFTNHSELSYVVSTIQTHKLLSEFSRTTNSPEDDEAWRAAVDSWVNRLLTLVSSNSPDKCWAGICLLGITCQECSIKRFSSSYSLWLNTLLPHIQAQEGSHLVKSACCASLSDFFTRLSGLTNAKKDATSYSCKIIQPLIKLLTEDISSVLLEEALSLLCTMIKLFPYSVNQHYDSVEAVIVSKLLSGKCNASVLEKLGYGLALLPQTRGDKDSWSLLMLKILLWVNDQLNDAFQGLEEEKIGTETMRLLIPAGKETPPPLGGLSLSELNTSELSLRRPERQLGFRISTLMNCCSNMLTSSYSVMVPLPVRGLVALARRVLMVDGSQSSNDSSMSTMKQEFICSELPLLHFHALDILMAVVKGLSSQLLPHVAEIVQLLMEYLAGCTFPHLRIKVYSIVKVLLMSMGTGFAIHLSQDIINNVFVDLDFVADEKSNKILDGSKMVQGEISSASRQRKRKHSNKTGVPQEENAHDGLPAEKALQYSTPISVKRAALEALEALLTVGGSVRSESWRENVDHLLITVATYAYKGGLSNEERDVLPGECISSWTYFRVATLRALLASLLSPGRVRPSHLGLSLELFRRSVQETGTEIAKLCGQALLSLEVLIHPRAVPLLDHDSSINGNGQTYTFQPRTPSRVGIGESDSDDDLNENWLGNSDELEPQLEQPNENPTESTPMAETGSREKLSSLEVRHDPKASELQSSANPIAADKDDFMIESPQNRNNQTGDSTFPYTKASSNDELEPLRKKVALSTITVKSDTAAGGSELVVSSSEHVEQNSAIEKIAATLASMEKMSGSVFKPENDEDIFPDIIDCDPDSD